MSKPYRFYDTTTGLFDRAQVMYPDAATVTANTPAGHRAIEGTFDHLSQRVDVAVDLVDEHGVSVPVVIDYQPDPPADDEWQTWSWNATTRRNVATPTLAALKRDRKQPVFVALEAEDAKLIRPNGEIAQALATSTTPPTAAVDRVIAINAAKQTLRDKLAAIDAAANAEALAAIPS